MQLIQHLHQLETKSNKPPELGIAFWRN